MKLTPTKIAEYRRQIEESNLPPELKQQALISISTIEKNDGDLVAATNEILLSAGMTKMPPETEKTLVWDDIVNDIPEFANASKELQDCYLADFLCYCKDTNSDSNKKSSWSEYIKCNNRFKGLSSTAGVPQVKLVQPKDIGVKLVEPTSETDLSSTLWKPHYERPSGEWNDSSGTCE